MTTSNFKFIQLNPATTAQGSRLIVRHNSGELTLNVDHAMDRTDGPLRIVVRPNADGSRDVFLKIGWEKFSFILSPVDSHDRFKEEITFFPRRSAFIPCLKARSMTWELG